MSDAPQALKSNNMDANEKLKQLLRQKSLGAI